MINDRQKLYNNNNTSSNNDDNNDNTNNSFRHISHRTNNNNYNKNSSSSGGRDKFSVTNSFRRYTCQQCDKIFTDPGVLHHHSRSAHSASRSHSCPECSKNFASSSGLKQHQHIHQSVKPFRCEVCLKAYTQFSNLCRHKRMHADCRQQIKCLDCGQAFSTLMSLNKHRRFCEGVMRRHDGGGALNPASCFLPLPGLDGAGSLVNPGAAASALAIHPSLGALESWCMHLYGCRPSAFPICPPAGYMACLPPSSALFPSQSMLAAAAQSSPLLLGSYMGLLPLQEDERKGESSLILRPSSSSSSSAEKRRRSREQKAANHDGQSSVTSPSAYESQRPEADRPEADTNWSLEGLGRSVKKEKEEVVEEEELGKEAPMEEEHEEEDRKNLHSPSEGPRPERRAAGSPLLRTPSPDEADGSGEDQQPLDLSTKSRTEVKSPLTRARTFTSRPDPLSSTSRSRSGTFEDSLRRPTGNDAKHQPSSKHARYSLDPSSFVPGTGFLSSVYHLRKDLIASYAGRDTSSTIHPNGTYQLGTARPELDNIRGFVGKADHGLQSTLLSPLVRLPDILSFKSTKPRYRYSCRYCGKVFPRSANLTRHLRTHTGEQPYRCKYCKRCFSISSNLQRHVRNIHNKEKPFRCPLCERCFGQQTNLDRHVKKHDTDTVDPCFSSSVPEYLAGSRPSGAHEGAKGGQGLREDEPYFKEIQNYFANTSSSSAFYLGRVGGQADEVTGSDEKEEEEDEEEGGEGGVREGEVEVKTELSGGADDTLQ